MRTFKFPIIYVAFVILFGIDHKVLAVSDIDFTWGGYFMERFKMELQVQSSSNGFTGRINMYDGAQMIQNDVIVDIILSDSSLSFYIPAKSTSFQGSFSHQQTQLSGNFIFPDNSRHPVQLIQKSETSMMKVTRAHAVLTREQMLKDIQFLANKIEELHPDPYYYTTRENYTASLDHVISGLPDTMSITDFYLSIWPLASSIKCSHTGLRLPPDLERKYHAKGKYLPIQLYFTGTGVYFTGPNENNSAMEPGAEIQTINGMPIDELRNQIKPMLATEGKNMNAVLYQLNRKFYEYLAFIFQPDTFRITARNNNQTETIPLVLPAKTYEEATAMWNVSIDGQSEYSFHWLREINAGLLHIPTFAPKDMDNYFSFLDSTFTVIKEGQIGNLVIDLRDNAGGHPIFAAQLLSYLVSEDFTYFNDENIMQELLPLYQKMSPSPKRFSGQIYVITNGGCLSTTGHFISLLKYHTTAVFVGDTPGSHFYCNDFSQQESLPESGILVNIPKVPFKTRVEGMTRNSVFLIDHPIMLTIPTIMMDQDPAMMKISMLLRKPEQL